MNEHSLTLNDGAVCVPQEQISSLLAVGEYRMKGGFSRGEAMVCHDMAGCKVARGLTNSDAQETL